MNIWKWFIGLFKHKRKPVAVTLGDDGFEINNLPKLVNPPPPPPKKTIEQIHEESANRFRPRGYVAPRSATARENELYAIKPNLQYWVQQGKL